MPQPQLTFFCELTPEPLAKLFDGRFVIDDLKALNATLSLGILDFSETRANLVKRLKKAGVPVIAWLLLPEEEGYWFNFDNYDKAAARYADFLAWTSENELEWAGVGLDIEMDINAERTLLSGMDKRAFTRYVLQNLKDKKRVHQVQRAYQTLVDKIRADGYPVESYQFPVIIDERRARTTVLQRIFSLVDLSPDREVLMLYSSFLRPHGAAILWSYAPEADSIGIGITGGGVDLPEGINSTPLSWEEFSRDLRLCIMQKKPIHIFSLEGCVSLGYLARLNTFNWDKSEPIPARSNQLKIIRTAFTALLWTLERPWVLLIGLATLSGLGFLFKRENHLNSNHKSDK
jgi:uncharacterized protein YlxP (DUF503 family)